MINWYKKCSDIIQKKTGLNLNDSHELLNLIMQELDDYGFVDSDWYTEIEDDDPRYGQRIKRSLKNSFFWTGIEFYIPEQRKHQKMNTLDCSNLGEIIIQNTLTHLV